MEHGEHEAYIDYEEARDEQEDRYDEDVFSLEGDLLRERRKQWIQYILVATLAALVVGAALYASILWTNTRLANEKSSIRPVTPMENSTGEESVAPGTVPSASAAPQPVNAWPSAEFPGIPVLESAVYETLSAKGRAEIVVPSATAKGFDDYVTALTEAGASVFVRTARLSIISLDGVEIHLAMSNQQNRVVLCGEPRYDWIDPNYNAFALPDTGKLVSVTDGVGAGSRILTYRGATTLDALEYAGSLAQAGWTLSGSLEPSNNIFLAIYKKNNLQITVDYFSSSDNYRVKLDYLG